MRMGGDDVGDLRRYESKAQLKKQGHGMHDALAYWEFCRVMKPGDTIFVKKGARLVLGHGVVRSDYHFDEARLEYKHVRDVEWLSRTDGVRIREKELVRKTLTDITKFPDQVVGAKRALNIEDSPVRGMVRAAVPDRALPGGSELRGGRGDVQVGAGRQGQRGAPAPPVRSDRLGRPVERRLHRRAQQPDELA